MDWESENWMMWRGLNQIMGSKSEKQFFQNLVVPVIQEESWTSNMENMLDFLLGK